MKNRKLMLLMFVTPFLIKISLAKALNQEELDQHIKENKKGVLLYVWSSLMPYSQMGIAEARKAAKKLKVKLVLARDLFDPESTVKEALTVESILKSNKLQHFPAAYYFKGSNKIGPFMGLKSTENYVDWVNNKKSRSVASDEEENQINKDLAQPENFNFTDTSKSWVEVKKVVPERQPKYFFRPFPDGVMIPYTNVFTNSLLNTQTKEEHLIWGLVDAVPTPDGLFLTVPFDILQPLSHLTFFDIKKIGSGDGPSKKARIKRDYSLRGAYQTIGLLGPMNYRVVTEASLKKGRLRIQEYSVTKNDKGEYDIKPKFGKAREFCSDSNLTMPVLSKSGRYFSAVDADSRQTLLYQLNDNLDCTLVKKAGFVGAKGDFDWEDKKIYFHKSTYDSKAAAYILKSPDVLLDIEVYSYDLVTGEIVKITNCNKEGYNCYYPNVSRDGKIWMIKQNKETKDRYFSQIELTQKDNQK
jgi:hypothetical protein